MTVYYQPGYRPDNNTSKCRCDQNNGCAERNIDCDPDKIIFRCNNITGASGVSIIAIGNAITQRTVGSVTVSDLYCFKRPCIKINFSSVVNFSAAIAVGTTLTFRIFKRCTGDNEVEIQSFNFTQTLALLAGASIPINFSVCDCNEGCSDGCCTYRVTIEATATAAVASAINVNQGTISVIAADMC